MDYQYTKPQGTGWGYTGQDPKTATKVKNVLTPEEMGKLFQKGNQFSLAITEIERLKAICTHRFENGMDALQDTGHGSQRCQICGHEFMPVPVQTTKDDIRAAVEGVKDILQTIKLIFLDMPVDVAREYFVLIALLDKIPDLFENGCKDYIRHEKFMPYGVYGNRTANILSIYNMITGGAGPETYMQYDEQGRPIDPGFGQNSAWAYGNPVYNYNNWGNPLGNMQASFGNYPYGFNAGTNGFVESKPDPDPNMYQAQTMGYKYDPMTGKPLNPNEDAKVTEVKSTFKA